MNMVAIYTTRCTNSFIQKRLRGAVFLHHPFQTHLGGWATLSFFHIAKTLLDFLTYYHAVLSLKIVTSIFVPKPAPFFKILPCETNQSYNHIVLQHLKLKVINFITLEKLEGKKKKLLPQLVAPENGWWIWVFMKSVYDSESESINQS